MPNKEQPNTVEEPSPNKPLKWIITLFLLFIFFVSLFPLYSIKINPSPRNIPALNDVAPENMEIVQEAQPLAGNEYRKFVNPADPVIKNIADTIAVQSCSSFSKVCYAKAMFLFVRDNFQYVNDPAEFEYVKSARESLANKGGDCDDASVLLANLLEAIGISARFVFVPGHVYVQAYVPESIFLYRDTEGWVNLDAACVNCDFGELPLETAGKRKVYVY